MKKRATTLLAILLTTTFWAGCSTSKEHLDDWWCYYNIQDNEQMRWTLKTIPDRIIHPNELKTLDLADLQLEDFMMITDDEEKDKLYRLITNTFSFDSLLEEGQSREQWFDFMKNNTQKNTVLFGLGTLQLFPDIKSVLIVKRGLGDLCLLELYCINIINDYIESIVQLNSHEDFKGQPVKCFADFNKRKRQCVIHLNRKTAWENGTVESNHYYSFKIDSQGKIVTP